MKIKEKTVLITGGTSGIGKSVVDKLADNNHMIVLGRNEHKLKALAAAYSGLNTYQCNLADLVEVEAVADAVAKNHPRIDLLINNAAVQFTPTFLANDFAFETIRQEINVNFAAVCSLIYLLLPSLLDENRHSIILNVNSGLGLVPKTNSAVYCGTKGALYVFSQSLKYQLEKTNIKVLQAILPLVDTAMTTGRGSGKISIDQAAEALIVGIENEIDENFIGKTKLLKVINHFSPGLARKIMKRY